MTTQNRQLIGDQAVRAAPPGLTLNFRLFLKLMAVVFCWAGLLSPIYGQKAVDIAEVRAKFTLPPGWTQKVLNRNGEKYYYLTRRGTRIRAYIKVLTFDEKSSGKDVLAKFLEKDRKRYKISFAKLPTWQKLKEDHKTEWTYLDLTYRRGARGRPYPRVGGVSRFGPTAITLMALGRASDFRRYAKQLKEIVASIEFLDDKPEEKKQVVKKAPTEYAAGPEDEKYFEE